MRSAATDVGTGTYTIATQVAAESLGLDIDQVQVEIGDTDLPYAPYSGGSGMATSLSAAIQDAVGRLVGAFLDLVAEDASSPLRGRTPDDVVATNGGIHVVDAPSVGERYVDMLARHGLPELTEEGELSEDGSTGVPKGMPQNCAAVLHRGQVAARYAKHHLPNYGVFDEDRYFTPGNDQVIIDVAGTPVGLTVCEDIWVAGPPASELGAAGAQVVANI